MGESENLWHLYYKVTQDLLRKHKDTEAPTQLVQYGLHYKVGAGDIESENCMALILDGNSDHVSHA